MSGNMLPAQALIDFIRQYVPPQGAAPEGASPQSQGSNLQNVVSQLRQAAPGTVHLQLNADSGPTLGGDQGGPVAKKAKRAGKGACTLQSVVIYGAVCETTQGHKLSTLVATPSASDGSPSHPEMYADRICGPVGKAVFASWIKKHQLSKKAPKEEVVHQLLKAAFPDASSEAYATLASHVCFFKQPDRRVPSKKQPSLPVHLWSTALELYQDHLNRGQTR